MLDWMFLIFMVVAVFFIALSLYTSNEEAFWKIMFMVLATVIWFILALMNLNIETPYSIYNSTTGNTTMGYSPYIDESSIYLSYFFGLLGCLCMIYFVILIFDTYYQIVDEKEKEP